MPRTYDIQSSRHHGAGNCGAHVFVRPPIPIKRRKQVLAELAATTSVDAVGHFKEYSFVALKHLHAGCADQTEQHSHDIRSAASILMKKALEQSGVVAKITSSQHIPS